MEIGIDSFAAASNDQNLSGDKLINELLDRIVLADKVGIDSFGIGEHHRKDFLDSAPTMILAAAAARTTRIRLTSAVTVLSAADPVRVFQNFATLDLISNGRAEIVAGRGSFTDAFPLFGYSLQDYDALFKEKLELLLQIRDNDRVTWNGKFRPALIDQEIFPKPVQSKMPIWLGVGGTQASFVRAGSMGLPLMVAIIGGHTERFRPLVDIYRMAGKKAGYRPEDLTVGLHSIGYVGKTKASAVADFYPGYKKVFDKIGEERGFGPVTRQGFDAQNGLSGALLVGGPEEIAEKIIRHSNSLGGVSRVTFNMDMGLPHERMMECIELLGNEVLPIIKQV